MHQPQHPTAMAPWDRVAAFARAQQVADDDITRLELLCAATAEVLSVHGVAATTGNGASLTSTPAPPPGVTEIDVLQYALGSGPGPTALDSRQAVSVDDTRADSRWPAYLEAATVAGFRAVLATPLELGDGIGVSLCAYSTSARRWSDDDEAATVVLCAIATAWATGYQVHDEQAQVVDQLQHALDSRVLIEQAKGVLATVEKVRTDEAFELMRGHARRRGIPVREVAAAVVDLGFRPPGGAPADTTRAARRRNSEPG